MNWLYKMIEQPAFTNSVDFEYQCRRNVLTDPAKKIATEYCGVEPPSSEKKAYKTYTDKHQVMYHRTMAILWGNKYGEKDSIGE